jgi:hypothetical protein
MKNVKIIMSLVALLMANDAKSMTSTERRAARRGGVTQQPTQVTPPVQTDTAKPMTREERRAARAPVTSATTQTPAAPEPSAQSYEIFYDETSGALKENGVKEFVEIIRKKHPSLTKVKLIATSYNDAIALLKPVSSKKNVDPNLTNKLMFIINNYVMGRQEVEGQMGKQITAPEVVKPVQEKLSPQPLKEEPVMTPEELKERLAAFEAEFYHSELQEKMAAIEAERYSDKKTNLITKEGIHNIVETIKTTAPTINNKELIAAAFDKASELLKEIRKKPTLNQGTRDGLLRMVTDAVNQYIVNNAALKGKTIDQGIFKQQTVKLQPQELGKAKLVQKQALPLEPIERRATIGSVPQPVIFTPPLKELETQSETETYGYEKTPTSFSSTVGIIPEPVIKQQKVSLGAMELGQAKLPLSDDVTKFINESKKQGITAKTMDQDWLMQAISHILNGKLTRENKAATLQKLFDVADAVVGVPLRADTTITDDEYDRISGVLDRRIRNFMSKLYVGTDYFPRKK